MHLNESYSSDRSGSSFPQPPSSGGPKPIDSTIQLLRQAYELAKRKRVDFCQFAIEIDQLKRFGISAEELRLIISSGMCEHVRETTALDADARTFTSANGEFGEHSCFILGQHARNPMPNSGPRSFRLDDPVIIKPVWDPQRSELRVAGQLVKRFKWAAPNQERLIVAFADMNWQDRIDDPFPVDDTVDAKRRLHDTIKCLNRRHVSNLMRFHGDGTGAGVIWRISVDRPLQVESQGLHHPGSESVSDANPTTHSC